VDELNQRDSDILRFLEQYWNEHYHSPSYEEIGTQVGLSKSNVAAHLNSLEAQGYVEIAHGASRANRLLRTANGYPFKPNIYSIPIYGYITAGEPIPLPESNTPLEWIDVARTAIHDAVGIFGLRVRGDSMIDALVNDGDIILLKQQEYAREGDSVAVRLLNDPTNLETTLKELHLKQDEIELRPRNPTLESKFYRPEEIEIIGVLIYVLSDRQNKYHD
jgi:repressor LexA